MEDGCEWKHFRNPAVAGAIAKITKQTLPAASGERGDQDRGRRFQLRPTSVVTKTEQALSTADGPPWKKGRNKRLFYEDNLAYVTGLCLRFLIRIAYCDHCAQFVTIAESKSFQKWLCRLAGRQKHSRSAHYAGAQTE